METPLDRIAANVAHHAGVICDYQAQSQQKIGIGLFPANTPESINRARQGLLQASAELQQICSEPGEYLEQTQIYYQRLSALQWLIHFNVLQHVPLDPSTSITYTYVAAVANVPLGRLRNVARMAMTGGILTEPRAEHIAHTRISAHFVTQPVFNDWVLFMTQYSVPTTLCFSQATEQWGDTTATHQTAYNLAFKTTLPFFAHIEQSQHSTEQFARYMRAYVQNPGLAIEHLLTGFDWEGLGSAHIVDVGGSTGQVDIMLATHFPRLTFTVQDRQSTIAGADIILQSLTPSVASRISFNAHDFWKPQRPEIASSADVYLLRRLLHDWPSAKARVILQNLVDAMRPGGRIVVVDIVLPPPGTVSPLQEASLRVFDLAMAQTFNSSERARSDWIELFASTTPALRLRCELQPFGSLLTVMEVVRDE